MQVLVLLAERRGTVVSREDLINGCWEGRIVGEDAIQRCIARLRDLARRTNAFGIETLPRVGYRLDVTPGGEPVVPRVRRPSRLVAVGLLAIFALAAAIGLQRWWTKDAPLRVQVDTLQVIAGKDAQTLAPTFQGTIVDVLNQSGIPTIAGERPALLGWFSRPAVVLRGSVAQAGRQLTVHLTLEDVPSGLTLWSERFEQEVESAAPLADAVAGAATETIDKVLELRMQKGLHPDPEIVALHIRGAALVSNPQFLREGGPREIYEQIVARAPDSAGGRALLALALVNEAQRATPADRPAFFARSGKIAREAIRIDPYAAGAAYDALVQAMRAQRPHDIVAAEDLLLEGLRDAPDYAFLSMRECRLLTDVGRPREAMRHCERALALRPFAGPIGHSHANALIVTGNVRLAEQALRRAARYNPDHMATRWRLFLLEAFEGSPALAWDLLHDPATQPLNMSQQLLETLEKYLVSRRSGHRADRDAAAEAMQSAVTHEQMPLDAAIMALTSLGHLDDAFATLRSPDMADRLYSGGSAFLFRPATAPLRADPRFWDIAARLGLARYWTVRGKWPDMCSREIPLAICKAETAKVLSAER